MKKLIDYWPILMVLGAGAVGYLNMKWTVDEMKARLLQSDANHSSFIAWRASIEQAARDHDWKLP